jgi:hypothetical protein
MQMGTLRYICKSLDHTAFCYRGSEAQNIGDMLGINHRGTDGAISVKRAGTTQNLGPKARAAAGWREVRSLEEVAVLLNPPGAGRKAA